MNPPGLPWIFAPAGPQILLGILGPLLLVFSLWMVVEADLAVLRGKQSPGWAAESQTAAPPQP